MAGCPSGRRWWRRRRNALAVPDRYGRLPVSQHAFLKIGLQEMSAIQCQSLHVTLASWKLVLEFAIRIVPWVKALYALSLDYH